MALTFIAANPSPTTARVTGIEAGPFGTLLDTGVMGQRYQMTAVQMALSLLEAGSWVVGRTGTTSHDSGMKKRAILIVQRAIAIVVRSTDPEARMTGVVVAVLSSD
jgi:hypothetical protein